MPDIFISYSRKDSGHAVELADRLRARGFDVWIDQHGIEVATQWSKQIVEAIETCRAFLLLLSPASLASRNVVRELSIASECERRILPVELEAVSLTSEFKYALAGIQRAQISDFEGIIRSLERTQHTRPESERDIATTPAERSDLRKSLMVLPFEDLSPMQDNGWFADGLTGELISGLSNVKSLRVIDRQTTMSFKHTKLKTVLLARELGVRYFLEGSVRKTAMPAEAVRADAVATDQIKISVELLDIETGDHIWQYAHRGTMRDIFDVQEEVAKKVVEGFVLKLTDQEHSEIRKRGTNNSEAYEFYLRGTQHIRRITLAGTHIAASLFTEATRLDPNYVEAYVGHAAALIELYIHYERDEHHLNQAESLIDRAFQINPMSFAAFGPRIVLLRERGRIEEAIAAAREYVARAPESQDSHFHLGTLLLRIGRPAEAIEPLERALELKPDLLPTYWNVILACEKAGDQEKRRFWADRALPLYAKFLRLNPDDENGRVRYANMLMDAGRLGDAHDYLERLDDVRDPRQIFNVGILAVMLHDYTLAIKYFTRAVDLGFRDFSEIQPDEDDELFKMPEYQELMRRIAEA
ncbi:MAG: TIR domain-containing protein [Bacteroidota bacterium]|nr:TIR domain-containing protein [Bacteroidota bacterium]MDP4232998.1 TIR domain-containing protein [Bacteroidota bacterium]MDP4242042.1 TIR domain-containing protein [Bacteroidota bacterium]